MLSEATEQLRAENIKGHTNTVNKDLTSINLDIPANIPSDYISDLHLRIDIYTQIIQAYDENSLKEIEQMMIDRFGNVPMQLENLLSISKLKLISTRIGIRSIFKRENMIVMRMSYDLKDMRIALQKRVNDQVQIGNREIRQQITENSKEPMQDVFNLVHLIDKFQNDMVNYLEGIKHSIE